MKSILVIGGGLVGAASALRLQNAGVQTTLIDPGDKRRGASYGNAGHLGPEQVSPWSTWENVRSAARHSFALGGPLDFRWRDVGLWGPWALRFLAACEAGRLARGRDALTALLREAIPAWVRVAELAQAPGIVRAHGHASVWMSAANADNGRAVWARTPIGSASIRDMTSAELERYAGVLRQRPHAGLVFSGTGQVRDPQAAREALLAEFVARGGEIVDAKVVNLSSDATARAALDSGDAREADAMLVAAGAWSRQLMGQLGVSTPLIGERGYSIQSAEHTWPDDLPTTMFEERSVVLSRFSSGLRATSFLEFGAPDAPADARKWRALERHVSDLGVQFSTTPDRWMGPRPTLPDYLPAIGRLNGAPKVFYAFGHHHLGLTMCAITSEIITALVTDNSPPIDISALRIERFT
jgi:D-amino-acid dehydrogenase